MTGRHKWYPKPGESMIEKEGCFSYKTALDRQVGGDHYKKYAIQPTEFCQKNRLDWCESNIVVYACRWRDKGGLEDLEKIKHYVDLLIEIEGLGQPTAR